MKDKGMRKNYEIFTGETKLKYILQKDCFTPEKKNNHSILNFAKSLSVPPKKKLRKDPEL